MLSQFRRFAGLLMTAFAGHLALVSGGVVCVVPGMSAASAGGAAHTADASMASMPGMADMAGMTAQLPDDASGPASRAPMSDDHGPCSGPPAGQCVASMPCVTVLGASADAPTLAAGAPRLSRAAPVDERMPASSTPAPELPPPRA